MRQAKKLGLLGLSVLALVAVFGVLRTLQGGTSVVRAQTSGGFEFSTPEVCTLPIGGSSTTAYTVGAEFNCGPITMVSPGNAVEIHTPTPGFELINMTATAQTNCTAYFQSDNNGGGTLGCTNPAGSITAFTEQWLVVASGTYTDNYPPQQQLVKSLECLAPESGVTTTTTGLCGGTFTTGEGGPISGGFSGESFIDPADCALTTGGTLFPLLFGLPCGSSSTTLPATASQPTGEEKFCNNVEGSINTGLPVSTTAFAGPSTSFTLPVFTSGPSTCDLIPTRNGTPCNNLVLPTSTTTTTSFGSNPCSDGYFVVSLTSPGQSATISCANTLNGTLTNPVSGGVQLSGGAGPCQQQTSGTSLLIPCGQTAAANPGSVAYYGGTSSLVGTAATCTGVQFNIQSILSGCVSEPTLQSECPIGTNASLALGGVATVTIYWEETPFQPDATVGGLLLGTNTFTFAPPPLGTLLVTASPEAIPSNGTTAAVVTATFACANGFQTTSTGFPLSTSGFSGLTTSSITNVNQPILGLGQGALCGAGLPGTFTFASPGPVLFDNGRSNESVSCGLSGQDNAFGVGGGTFGNFGQFNSATFPLVFTCTGAAVLAIGAGAAGDAPINVTYQSSVGGLQAVGSSLLIVSPSGVPRISVACSPSTIAAGNTGSICTATVTDQNGVPLSGITGATVTFTVSDTTEATILPCVVAIPGSINVTTSPNVLPQVVPTTPCNPPSGTIPGQVQTFINGQASALLVASSYARPEVVTVSASLGVLIPPEFACLVSPYTPVGFGSIPAGGFAPVSSGVGLPGLSGCGASNPIGYTGLASALSADSTGLTGIVTLPNTTSASTTVQIGGPAGILIAGATTTSPLQLTRGCNQVIVTSTQGTPIANVAALVSPAASVVSIWRFSNSTKQFQAGFFSDPSAPTDFVATGLTGSTIQGTSTINSAPVAAGTQVTETYFVCVNQAAAMISG